MKSKTKVLLYSILLVMVLFIAGISYAYFSANITGLESESTIVADSGEMTITFASGDNNVGGSGISPDSAPFATKTFTVTGTNTTTKLMPYNISIVIDVNTFTSGALSYTLESENTSKNGSVIAPITTNQTIGATNLVGTGKFANGTVSVHTYTINFYFLSTDSDQYEDFNKQFAAHIVIGSLESTDSGVSVVISKVGTTTNGGLKAVAHPATLQTPAQMDYRYYGANPDNWAYFNCSATDGTYDYGNENYNYASNCELWRIIGVFDAETPVYTGNTITSYKTEKKIKLIRNDSIGSYSWDTSASTVNDGYGINEWSQADIMKLMNPRYDTNQDLNNGGTTITVNNSLYWNRQSGTCYNGAHNATTSCDFTSTGIKNETKNYISESKYYTAGDYSSGDSSSKMYSCERGNLIGMQGTGDTIVRKTNSTNHIGLMYLTDYGYAVDENLCNQTLDYYYNSTCKLNNWLFNSSMNQRIITSISNVSSGVFGVGYNGYAGNYGVDLASDVRPVLYLDPGIYTIGGEGTQSSPYKFSL